MKSNQNSDRLPVGHAARLKGSAPSNGHVKAPNPAQMIEHHRKSAWRHLRLIPVTVGALVLLEVFAPLEWKPTNLAGEAVTRYRTHIAIAEISATLTLDDERPYAGVLADRMNERASWTGLCNVAGVFERDAGTVCQAAVDSYYNHAIADAERNRDRRFRLEPNR